MALHFLFALAAPLAAGQCAIEMEGARQAYQDKDYTLAARRFERAVAACPSNANLLLDLAKVKYLLGDSTEAERLLRTAAEVDPQNPELHYALGRIYYHEVRLHQAVEQFEKALALDPAHHRAYDNMGLAFEGLNDFRRALECYEKALALVHKAHPAYDSVYANVADLLYHQAEFERSFQYAAEAASRNPSSARNFFLTGRALAKLERWEQSLKWLRQAVSIDPAHPAANYQLAQVYRSLGRIEDAERQLQAFQKISQPQADYGK
jgi:tetratricopeptide (TPR) repeat protein